MIPSRVEHRTDLFCLAFAQRSLDKEDLPHLTRCRNMAASAIGWSMGTEIGGVGAEIILAAWVSKSVYRGVDGIDLDFSPRDDAPCLCWFVDDGF